MTKRRTFIPPSKHLYREVHYWFWTASAGLRVAYRDGTTARSAYTLKELLAEERPIETSLDWNGNPI